MLAIDNCLSESSLSLLQHFRISFAGHSCWFQAKHGSKRKGAVGEFSLRHRHKPVCREELVSATWAALLDIVDERFAVEHQHPAALLPHQHFRRRRIRLCK